MVIPLVWLFKQRCLRAVEKIEKSAYPVRLRTSGVVGMGKKSGGLTLLLWDNHCDGYAGDSAACVRNHIATPLLSVRISLIGETQRSLASRFSRFGSMGFRAVKKWERRD